MTDSNKEALLRRIQNDHTYHIPKPGQADRYTTIRSAAKEFATLLVEQVPASRELSLALTAVETAVFNANAGIARHE